MNSGERKQITKRYTENFDAYQHYLIGRNDSEKRTEEAYQKAIEHYKQALDLDPNYALAYVGLADAYYLGLGSHHPLEENIRQSRAAAEKALAIDETIGEAHTSLARGTGIHIERFFSQNALRFHMWRPCYNSAFNI